MLCILLEVLSRAHANRGKSLNDFKFGTSIGRFSSNGAESTAVKGLRTIKYISDRILSYTGQVADTMT